MRKAQITIYIILGLLLVLSISLITYFAQQRPPTAPVIFVPEEARPVHDFVTTCFTQLAQEALVKLGLQGGYLYLPQEIAKTPTAYLSLDQQHTFKLPYWYYEGYDRTPALESMQNQLSQYLLENVNRCTQHFNRFEPIIVEQLSTLQPETIIGDETVIIKLTWPLVIKLADKSTKIQDFVLNLPVRLKQAWQLADAVMKAENKQNFFENRTLDFMSANENIPTEGFLFECGPKRWRIPDIKKELQDLLHYIIPTIRIENTHHTPFEEKRSVYNDLAKSRTNMLKKLEQGVSLDEQTPPSRIPEDAYEFFKLTLRTDAAPTDLKAGFSYSPTWGLLLAAEPNDGNTLRSNLGKGAQKYLPFVCINQWHFVYDVIYPVKLIIKDEKAFLNKGYLFQIAFPVIINSNAPDRVFFGIQKFPEQTFSTEFCGLPGDTIVDLRAKGFIEDAPIAAELKDATLSYRCFNQYCDLGTTKADEGHYRLRTTLPQGCSNPIITATKDGYLSSENVLTGDTLELVMTKLKKMNISIVVRPYNLQDKQYLEPQPLQPNQRASLRLSLRNNNFEQYKEYPRDTDLEIVDGKASYDLDVILLSNDVQIGGYLVEGLNLTYQDIADKNTMIINAIELRPHPRSTQQRGEMIQFLYTNEAYKKELKPTFR